MHTAVGLAVGSRGVGVRHVQLACVPVVRGPDRHPGGGAGGLLRDGLPGRAVGRAVQAGLAGRAVGVAPAGVDRTARRDEERDPLAGGTGCGREAHGLPGGAPVGRLEQPVVPGPEPQGVAVPRVDEQPLPAPTPVLVAPELHGEVGALPGGPTVLGPQHGPVAGPGLRVRPEGEVQPVRVGRVDGHGLHAEQVPVVPADVVGQRDPPVGPVVPAVGTADVGTGVGESADGGVEENAGDEAGAALDRIAPAVRGSRGGRGRGGLSAALDDRKCGDSGGGGGPGEHSASAEVESAHDVPRSLQDREGRRPFFWGRGELREQPQRSRRHRQPTALRRDSKQGHHPLTAPVSMPFLKCFWTKGDRKATGSRAITMTAI